VAALVVRTLALASALAVVAGPATAAGGGFPRAIFTATVSGKSPLFLNGAWRLTFRADGRYTTEHPLGETVARGRLTTSGATVAFGKETGSVACATAGRYRWSYDGTRLRLAAIADPCGGREIVLTGQPFRRFAG
jgi:hypothetical protein